MITFPTPTIIGQASFVSGSTYAIKTIGTTNWTSIGASVATIGTIFVYNGVTITGSGGDAWGTFSVDGKTWVWTGAKWQLVPLGTASTRNVPVTGNATSTQVVLGSDTRLTGAMPVTATGSTTSRTLANRFADVVNVLDYGAFNNGSNATATTAAIQAAINANPGKVIYFPAGTYWIDDKITIATTYTSIVGDASGASLIRMFDFTKSCAFEIKSATAGGSVFGVIFENIAITRPASSTYQAGIILESANSTRIMNCDIVGFPTALDIRSGVNCFYSNLRLSAFGSTNTTAGKATIQLEGSSYATNPTSFTHLFTNCNVDGNFTNPYVVKITSIDFISFSNSYFGAGLEAGVYIQGGDVYVNYGNNFDNCFFDRASLSFGSPDCAGIIIKTPTSATKQSQYNKFTNCTIGLWDIGMVIEHQYDPSIEIVGCLFGGNVKKAILVKPSGTPLDSYTSLVLSGNQFRANGLRVANSSIIDIEDIRALTMSGNSFYWDYTDWFNSGSISGGTKNIINIKSGATIQNLSITGNSFSSVTFGGTTVNDFVNNSSSIDTLCISGNVSNNATNTLVGHVIGNQLSSNPLMLDWYQEGTFNPVVAFGGSSVGVTYATRVANYTRIGNRMMFDIYINLSSKGGLTGDMTIGGFPYPLSPSGTSTGNLSISLQGVDGIGSANIDGLFNTTTTAIARYINSSGNAVNVTAANMRDNSLIFLSGVVQVA